MIKTKSVHSSSTVAPAPTITIAVTFNTEEWPVIVEAMANGSWTASDCEKFLECTMTIRRHADGRTLVSYRSCENETCLSSWAVMSMPQTTTDAIDWVCAHLLANASGFWRPLVASFKEKYIASPEMKVPKNIVYKGYNFNTIVLSSGIRVQVGRRPPQVSFGQ